MENIKGNEEKFLEIKDNIRMFILPQNFVLYKSILNKYDRESTFYYESDKDNDIIKCRNISWFGSKHKANYYKEKQKEATVFEYINKFNLNLFVVNNDNNLNLFKNYVNKFKDHRILKCLTEIKCSDIESEKRKHFEKYEYLKLDKRERVIYEYCFAFGYLTIEKQFLFSKLLIKLQEYQIIPQIKNMKEGSFSSLFLSLLRRGYNIYSNFFTDKHILAKEGSRFSIYHIDKNVVSNLCLLFSEHIDGYIFCHYPSYWHKMDDLTEIAIFNPRQYLK